MERAVYRAADPGAPIAIVAFDPFASPYRPLPPVETAAAAPDRPAAVGDAPDAGLPSAAVPLDYRAAIADIERRLLAEALTANRHNQRATARHLGLTYHQLRNTLAKHALLPSRQGGGEDMAPVQTQ